MKKGLTVTVSSVALFLGVNHIAAAAQTHTTTANVKLTEIANQFATNIDEIKSLNKLDNQSTTINAGTTITLPDRDIIEVVEGDTLLHIANKHHITLDKLYELNPNITELIHPGQLIAISEKGSQQIYKSIKGELATSQDTDDSINEGDAQSYISNNSSNFTSQDTSFNQYQTWESQTVNSYSTAYDQSMKQYNNMYHQPQPQSQYSGANYYDYGQCTAYAFERRSQLGKPVSNLWGNANQWANAAKQSGYQVNNQPEVGAIIQSTAGPNGHVGVVERRNQDGSILVSEMNWQGFGQKSYRTINQPGAYNYIH